MTKFIEGLMYVVIALLLVGLFCAAMLVFFGGCSAEAAESNAVESVVVWPKGVVADVAPAVSFTNALATNWWIVGEVTTATNYAMAPPTVAEHIEDMAAYDQLTNVIERLLADGTVCAVRGHDWKSGCGLGVKCAVYHHWPTRHCTVCDKEQSKEPGDWK